MRISPFLSYYGAKWRAASKYPRPAHDLIVEPFAGGAGYALNYPERDVLLVEKDPRIASIWRYLINATRQDILDLPLLPLDAHINDLPECHPDGRELIRSWLQGGSRNAKSTFSSMAKANLIKNPNTPSFWGAACRLRIANQVDRISHWKIIEGSYEDAPDLAAAWFIDPPYNNDAGKVYRYHSLDYGRLALWCRSRAGQVMVCENDGATWLPFQPLFSTSNNWNGITKKSGEVLWTNAEFLK